MNPPEIRAAENMQIMGRFAGEVNQSRCSKTQSGRWEESLQDDGADFTVSLSSASAFSARSLFLILTSSSSSVMSSHSLRRCLLVLVSAAVPGRGSRSITAANTKSTCIWSQCRTNSWSEGFPSHPWLFKMCSSLAWNYSKPSDTSKRLSYSLQAADSLLHLLIVRNAVLCNLTSYSGKKFSAGRLLQPPPLLKILEGFAF